MNVAVLGVGRIGKFHVREFKNAGCNVIAILGSTKENVERKAREIEEEFGIKVNPFYKIEDLLKENLDVVSICTPYALHSSQVESCISAGLHVLCEKPLVADSISDNYEKSKYLLELASKKKKILAVNTQWPTVLPKIRENISFSEVQAFEMLMEPGLKGSGLLLDFLPHANSMLISLVGLGEIRDLQFIQKSDEECKLEFIYTGDKGKSCKVGYHVKYKEDRPRKVDFVINGEKIERIFDQNYHPYLRIKGKEIPIDDPLRSSISNFVQQIEKKEKPLISAEEILKNIELQDYIMARF